MLSKAFTNRASEGIYIIYGDIILKEFLGRLLFYQKSFFFILAIFNGITTLFIMSGSEGM